jgi:hypothetical protein
MVSVEGEGFEPSKAEPTDLQSVPFDRSGTPPGEMSSPDQRDKRLYQIFPVKTENKQKSTKH